MKKFLSVLVVLCCTLACNAQEVDGKKVCVMKFDLENFKWEPVKGCTLRSGAYTAETNDNGIAKFEKNRLYKGYVGYDIPNLNNSYQSYAWSFEYNDEIDTIFLSHDIDALVYAQARVFCVQNVLKHEKNLSKLYSKLSLIPIIFDTYSDFCKPDAESYKQFFNGNLDYEKFTDNSNFLLLNPTDENLDKWIKKEFSSSTSAENLNNYTRSRLANEIYEYLNKIEELYDVYKSAVDHGYLLDHVTISDEITNMAVEKHDTTLLRYLIKSKGYGAKYLGNEYNDEGNKYLSKGELDNAQKYYDAAFVAYDCIEDITERNSNLLYPMANIALVAQNKHQADAEDKWMKTLNLVTEIENSIENGTARRAWTERAIGHYYGFYAETCQSEKAIKYLDLAIQHYDIASKTNPHELQNLENSLWIKAKLYQTIGEKKKAIKTFKQEITILDKLIMTNPNWAVNKARVEAIIRELN